SVAFIRDDPVAALEHAQKAIDNESTNYLDLVRLGKYLDATDKTDDALKKLRRAIEVAPTDPAPYVALVQTLAARGRSNEIPALLLANGTDFGRFRDALELAGLHLEADGQLARESTRPRLESTEALLTRARVLATQPQKAFRERAVDMFENLDRNQALTPNDKF